MSAPLCILIFKGPAFCIFFFLFYPLLSCKVEPTNNVMYICSLFLSLLKFPSVTATVYFYPFFLFCVLFFSFFFLFFLFFFFFFVSFLVLEHSHSVLRSKILTTAPILQDNVFVTFRNFN